MIAVPLVCLKSPVSSFRPRGTVDVEPWAGSVAVRPTPLWKNRGVSSPTKIALVQVADRDVLCAGTEKQDVESR